MFCPECKAEYREGYYTCAHCKIGLIDELPPEHEPEFVEFEEIIATYNPADIAFLKSMLESADIVYFFKGEHFLHLRPLVDPARLMVRKDQAEFVRELIQDLNLAFIGINLLNDDKNIKENP